MYLFAHQTGPYCSAHSRDYNLDVGMNGICKAETGNYGNFPVTLNTQVALFKVCYGLGLRVDIGIGPNCFGHLQVTPLLTVLLSLSIL